MTTTTEPTTTPVPAWLNLDAIAPTEEQSRGKDDDPLHHRSETPRPRLPSTSLP